MAIPRAVLQDSDILPPQMGLMSQTNLAAATASTAQDTGITEATAALGPQFITLIGAAEFYIVFSVDGTSTITDPVVATPTCMGPYPASVPVNFRVSKLQRYFKLISTPGGNVKWYLSSGPGQ